MADPEISLGGGGGFFGGLASGFGSGTKQVAERKKQEEDNALAVQKQAGIQQNQQKTEAAQRIAETMKFIKEFSDNARSAGNDDNKIAAAVQPFVDSIKGLAPGAGMDPEVAGRQALLSAMTPGQQDKKHTVVKIGSSATGDTFGVLEQGTGKVIPIGPGGQPVLSPEETITPRQAAVANPVVASPPQDEAAIPPNAKPAEGTFDQRFIAPAPSAPPPNPNVNTHVIEKLDPGSQEVIKGIADGTIDVKTFSARTGKFNTESERSKLLKIVKEYDPSFDMTNYGARSATLKAFKSGVEARKLSALGTVVGHVNELKKEGEALDNWKSDTFGPATKAANAVRLMIQENKQSPAITRFDNAATAVSNELENAFRGNNTAISGIQEWRKSINAGMASDQIAESTKSLGKLLLARMGELKEQWDRGMGHNQDQSIALKLAATRDLLEKMSAGTLFSDRAANAPPPAAVKALKDKYGLQ